MWCGSYFFCLGDQLEGNHGKVFDWVEKIAGELQDHAHVTGWPGPDLIASTTEMAVVVDPASEGSSSATHRLRGFKINGTVVLLAHLLSHIALRRTGNRATFGDVAEIEQGEPLQPHPSRDVTWLRRSG